MSLAHGDLVDNFMLENQNGKGDNSHNGSKLSEPGGNGMMNTTVEQAFTAGVLDPDYHSGLLRVLDPVLAGARLPRPYILNDSREFITQEEIEYLKGWRRRASEGQFGLLLTNVSADVAKKRMYGMAGMLIRNGIRVQVRTLHEVFDMIYDDDPLDKSALLVPDFQLTEFGELSDSKKQQLYGMLMSRMGKEKQTLVYVQDTDTLADTHGEAIAEFLTPPYFELIAK